MFPAEQGYYFPPEWHPHEATWLSWPHNADTWPNHLPTIYHNYVQFIKIISGGELVCINVKGPAMQRQAEEMLSRERVDLSRIRFYYHPTNDAWCRDHGPAFLVNASGKDKIIVDWDYNAWGEKYPPFDLDNAIPSKVAKALSMDIVKPGLVMEGGSVDFNGAGTLLTTSSCLLNPNRNPRLRPDEIEAALKNYYGVKQILWLKDGIEGDDTDGHIDDIARFVGEDKVVAVEEHDTNEANYGPLQKNLDALRSMQLWDGRSLQVHTVPMPKPQYREGQRLPVSYANFYICNAAVIVPLFEDPQDERALKTLQNLFRDRPVVGLDSRQIIGGLGSFHCLSQQEPRV